jgi:NAD(P)-dependent dehydrogenase (short-subunit alcohol dehydrogenase family)
MYKWHMNIPAPVSKHSVIVGAGSAIGAALVEACLAAPDCGTVHAVSRHPRTFGAAVRWRRADPTDAQAITDAARAIAAETPHIHRLIVCTGVLHGGAEDPGFRPEKSLGQLELAHLQRCITVNAWAPLAAIHAFAPLLRHPEGSVAAALSAQVGSIGDNRMGGWYSYRMSKAALNMGLRTAAIELGRHRHGPTVVAIHPGTTQSPLS